MKKLGLLLFAFILFSCSSSDDETSYTLTLKNSYDELVFTQVALKELRT
jgi:hypothetical protein